MSIKLKKFFSIRFLRKKFYLVFYKCYRTNKKTIFFFPHPNCEVDKYDVIRYHSDNALCVVNYMIRDSKYDDYKLFIAVYKESSINSYISYCKQVNPRMDIMFVSVKNPCIVKIAAKCELYFTDTTSTSTFYKKKKSQTVVDLGYFVPFKNLYLYNNKERSKALKNNGVIDYALTTADIPARALSLSFGIPLEKILPLGFCRNDIFYHNENSIKEDLLSHLNRKINKVIIFLPTWRNYEYRGEARNTTYKRSLFGYDDKYTDMINDVLEKNNSILIAKLHPLQCNINVNDSARKNILLYKDIEDIVKYSLYQILCIADGMITDYTTAYWDFLNRDKPVIFNFYDYEKYKETRGFSFNPIDFFCAGPIVKDGMSLVNAITDLLNNKDDYKEERRKMHKLFDSHCDGNNTKRIVEYFVK